MKTISNLLLLLSVVLCGCNAGTEKVVSRLRSVDDESNSSAETDDPADCAFHRDVAFTDVTQEMPDGSVDHKDFNTASAIGAQHDKSIEIFCGPTEGRKGLKIVFPEISASETDETKVTFKIINLLEEEVFLEVTGIEIVDYNLNRELDDNTVENNVFYFGGGVLFPDNTKLLKRLHSTSYKDGKPSTCGCAIASINTIFRCDDFTSWTGATGTISLEISGYRRSDGSFFSESVEVPIEIVK